MRGLTRPAPSLGRRAAAALRRALLLPRVLLLFLPAMLPWPAAADPPGAVPAFQRLLDRHDIPYTVPAPGKALLVNVPGFELVAFLDGQPQFRSRVIVGTPWHPTPLMETATAKVRFRPSWRPTPAMVASGEYRDRIWPPGPSNPLGLAAVHLADNRLVYLHDTNHREYFEREVRALSHGCIRVQAWDRLVSFVLDMPLDEVHRLANGTATLDVEAPPIPVSIRYLTAFVAADGSLAQYEDIYRRLPGPAAAGSPAPAEVEAAGVRVPCTAPAPG